MTALLTQTELNLRAMRGDQPCGYADGTQRDRAIAYATGIVDALDEGRINEDWGYTDETIQVRRIVVAGGGPSVELLITPDDEAIVVYTEGSGPVPVALPSWTVDRLKAALNAEVDL